MPWKKIELVYDVRIFSLCAHPYHGHPKGCKNFKKKCGCPPDIPPFRLRLDRDLWVIWAKFDLGGHIKRMKVLHPDWTEHQIVCPLYWQGTSKKMLRAEMAKFHEKYPDLLVLPRNSHVENHGWNITESMARIGEHLEWPARNVAYELTIAGTPVLGISDKEWEALRKRWPLIYRVRDMPRPKDSQGLQNMKFGMLFVEKFVPGAGWVVRCDCGKRFVIQSRSILLRGGSCGCQDTKPCDYCKFDESFDVLTP